MEKNILIAGVGGQGSLLASRVLGSAAILKGYDVKVSEVHGMSQRGGSVVTYVKYSDKKIYSPVVCRGEADIIIAFEQLEALRWISYLKKGGVIITSTQIINPMPVITGESAYPENIVEKIKGMGIDIIAKDAVKIALEVGNEKASNIVLLGTLAAYLNEDKEIYMQAMKNSIPQKILDLNIKAFESGYVS